MAMCSYLKSTQLALGQQRRDLGHHSAVQRSVRTRVAQPPSTSSAPPSSGIFKERDTLVEGHHFTQHQAESLLAVFPTMKDVASKDDVARLERTMKTGFDQMREEFNSRFDKMREEFNSRFHQMQLLAVLLALAVVAIVCLLAGALVFFPLNPGSALGMVVSAVMKKV